MRSGRVLALVRVLEQQAQVDGRARRAEEMVKGVAGPFTAPRNAAAAAALLLFLFFLLRSLDPACERERESCRWPSASLNVLPYLEAKHTYIFLQDSYLISMAVVLEDTHCKAPSPREYLASLVSISWCML